MTTRTRDVPHSGEVMATNKPLTMADAEALISGHLANGQATMDRGLWIARNMGDLPVIYRESMPLESSPDKLMAAEQAIREQYRKDMKTHAPLHSGYLAVNPDGSLKGQAASDVRTQMGKAQADADSVPAGEAEPAPDLSKMTTSEKIAMGLQQSRGTFGQQRPMVTTQTRSQPVTRGVIGGLSGSTMSTNQKLLAGLAQSAPAQRRR